MLDFVVGSDMMFLVVIEVMMKMRRMTIMFEILLDFFVLFLVVLFRDLRRSRGGVGHPVSVVSVVSDNPYESTHRPSQHFRAQHGRFSSTLYPRQSEAD